MCAVALAGSFGFAVAVPKRSANEVALVPA